MSDAAVLEEYRPAIRAAAPARRGARPLTPIQSRWTRVASAAGGGWRFARYLVAGGSSLLLQLAIQWLFITWGGLPPRPSIAVAYEIALLAHFFVNHRWVFGQPQHSWRRLVAFHVAALAAEAITFAVAFVVVSEPVAPYFGRDLAPYAGTVLGTGAAFAWTFISSFYLIWRRQAA